LTFPRFALKLHQSRNRQERRLVRSRARIVRRVSSFASWPGGIRLPVRISLHVFWVPHVLPLRRALFGCDSKRVSSHSSTRSGPSRFPRTRQPKLDQRHCSADFTKCRFYFVTRFAVVPGMRCGSTLPRQVLTPADESALQINVSLTTRRAPSKRLRIWAGARSFCPSSKGTAGTSAVRVWPCSRAPGRP